MRRSSTDRFGVMPLAEQLLAGDPAPQNSLLSSKSMFVVPDGSCTRDQKSSRNPSGGVGGLCSV